MITDHANDNWLNGLTCMAALILSQPSILSSGGLATYLRYIQNENKSDRICNYGLRPSCDIFKISSPSSSSLGHCLAQFAPADNFLESSKLARLQNFKSSNQPPEKSECVPPPKTEAVDSS